MMGNAGSISSTVVSKPRKASLLSLCYCLRMNPLSLYHNKTQEQFLGALKYEKYPIAAGISSIPFEGLRGFSFRASVVVFYVSGGCESRG